LQRWAPETSDDLTDLSMLLESDAASKGKGSTKWDQFAANQQLFGTATSYNEDLYTTKLDKGASAISVQEAERLAAEIQGGATSNRHMAEERGALMDSGVGILLWKPM
jgi:PAB1-binding protein PBP1